MIYQLRAKMHEDQSDTALASQIGIKWQWMKAKKRKKRIKFMYLDHKHKVLNIERTGSIYPSSGHKIVVNSPLTTTASQ